MRALVLSSGGVDSATALGMAVSKHGAKNVVALSILYGQKHDKELIASDAVAKYYGVEHISIDVSTIFSYSDCSLLKHSDKEIPKKSYAEQIVKTREEEPVSTYVPYRNGLFLSVAASIALDFKCDIVYYGIHSDDAAGYAYPDCSDVFNNAQAKAIYEGSGRAVKLVAPFVNMNKAEVVKTGLELGVPYELTWSCYEGGDVPCGCCGTCIDRTRAFELNGVKDPLLVKLREDEFYERTDTAGE